MAQDLQLLDGLIYKFSLIFFMDVVSLFAPLSLRLIAEYTKSQFGAIFEPSFEDIIDKSISYMERKYGISKSDFKEFLKSPEVEEHFEQATPIDLNYLAKILKDFGTLPESVTYESVLKEFIIQLENNLAKDPRYATLLSANQHREMLDILKRPEVYGKVLETGNLQNIEKFFKNCIELLREPYYDYQINLDTNGNLKISVTAKPGANEDKLLHGTVPIKIRQKDGTIVDFKDKLDEAYRNNASFIIEKESLVDFSAFKGTSSLLQNPNMIDFIEIVPIQPDPIRISVPGCCIVYEIILKMEKGSSSTSGTLSNMNQKSPLEFAFNYNLNSEGKLTGTFNIHKNLDRLDAKQAIQFSEFQKAAKETGFLMLQKKGSASPIPLSISIPDSALDSEEYIRALRKLAFIQDITKTSGPCPMGISAQDLRDLDELTTFFKTGSMQKKAEPFDGSIEKKYAKLLLDKLDDSSPINDMCIFSRKEIYVVCGLTVPLGPIKATFPPLRLTKSIIELKAELDRLKEDCINIKFVPISDSNVSFRRIEALPAN